MSTLAGLESMTGTQVFIAAGEPSTFDKAGYEALTWVKIDGIVSIGEWGDTEADVSEGTLSEGRAFHLNGVKDGGEVTFTVQHRETDAGSTIIKNNKGSNAPFSFKKQYVSGDAEYVTGIIGSHRQREAAQDAVRGYTATARINTAVLEVSA